MAGPINIRIGVINTDYIRGIHEMRVDTSSFTAQASRDFTQFNRVASQSIGSLGGILSRFGGSGGGLGSIVGPVGQLSGMSARLAPLTSALGGLFAADKVLGFGQAIVDTTGKFEKYQSILRNTLQSGSGAKEQLNILSTFAADTPNSLDELTSSFIKFANRGLIPTKQQLTNFGDLAASQGKGFDQLTEAILDAQSGEFERLKEFGIRASKSGDNVTLAFKGVSQTVKLTNEDITAAIQKFGQLTGVAGSMSAVAQTQEGLVSNLGDTYDRLLVALGESGVGGAYKGAIKAATSFLSVVTELVANSPAEDLRKQQTELNGLVGAIALANDNEGVRLSLIQELTQKYPEFLGKLDAESITTDLLAKRLADVNTQYDKKIRIALGEEKVKKATEDLTGSIRQQGEALQLLSKLSGKSLTDLEKLSAADRINLAKQIESRQQRVVAVPGGGVTVVTNRLTNLSKDLEEGASRQAKAQAELNQYMKENATRTADLTKTTVDGYKAQIAQIQQKIKLHQIDSKIGAEEIKRLSDQIRVAQGLAPILPKVTVTPKVKVAAPKEITDKDIVSFLKRTEEDLERQIQGLSKKELELQTTAFNNNDSTSLFVKLRAIREEMARLGNVTNNLPSPEITGIKELTSTATDDRLRGVIGQFVQLQTLLPTLGKTNPFNIQLTDIQKLIPNVETYQALLEDLRKKSQDFSLKGLEVSKEARDSVIAYTAEILKLQRTQRGEDALDLGLAHLKLAKEDIAAGDTFDNFKKVFAGFNDSAIEAFGAKRDQVILTAKEMTGTLVSVLQQGAVAGTQAMGEFIGGLVNGTSGIADLPKIILGAIGGVLKQLGQTLLSSAALMLFVPGLQGQAVLQLAAGGGLIALGTAATAAGQVKNYEGGGLFTGTSVIRVGESAKALSGGGEFVAPVALGAQLIGDRIMSNLNASTLLTNRAEVKTPDLRKLGYQRQPIDVSVGGEVVLDGRIIRIALHRANESDNGWDMNL